MSTFNILLRSCTSLNLYDEGRFIHEVSKIKIQDVSPQLTRTIINFYTKCGHPEFVIEECEKLKEKKEVMDVVSWNCLIKAFIQLNNIKKAISLLDEMRKNGVSPNSTTFNILISACGSFNLYEEGRFIHEMATIALGHCSTELFTGIINFYTKCGHPEIAIEEYEKLQDKGLMDIVSWTCLIQAFIQSSESTLNLSKQGHGLNKAIYAYIDMKNQGIRPDSGMYLVLLTACSEYVAKGIGLKIIEDITFEGIDLNEDIC